MLLWAALAGQAPAVQAADAPEPPPASTLAYEFGRGLRLGDSGFTLGGYATLEYRNDAGAREQFKSGHASAFVWWEGLEDRLKVFAEIDVLNAVSHERKDDYNDARRVSLERLYADYSFNDALIVRAGKFLTPIGRWNLIHAEPLVWTTSSPFITLAVFPRNVTGASVSGQLHGFAQTLGYAVYASNGSEWRADRWQDPFSHVRGLRLTLPVADDLQLGLSVANYALNSFRTESRQVRGFDLYWSRNRYELTAEWLRTNPQSASPMPLPLHVPDGRFNPLAAARGEADPSLYAWAAQAPPPQPMSQRRTQGGFVQGVAPLSVSWYLVLRAEWLDDARLSGTARRMLAGLTWRPNPATAVKLEWAEDDGNPLRRGRSLASSLSVLF